jgi:two-component system, OmpR family, sensor kinase
MPADGKAARPRTHLAPAGHRRSPARLRLMPAGLRWRLALWVALVVVLSTGVAFVAVYRGTGTQLRGQIDRGIEGDAAELAHALTSSGARTPKAALAAASGYIRGQPFSASSTLLFVLVPGAGIADNTPELFGRRVPDDGESAGVQEEENRLARRLLGARDGYTTLNLADVGRLRLLKRTVSLPAGGPEGRSESRSERDRPKAGPRVTIGVGESSASVARAQGGVARAFVLAGLLALAGALLGALLIGARFSRPLRRMAAVAAQVDGGDLHPRIHDIEREGREVRVLADAFNHMLDRLTDAFAGQRAFVADASHELRTPLTVIRGQMELLAAQAPPSEQELRRVERLVQAEITRVTRLVDDLLLLAKAEHTQFLRPEPIDLASFVEELWAGTVPLAERRFELGEVPAGTLDADPDRLAQALRNLLANAIAHTRGPGGRTGEIPGGGPERGAGGGPADAEGSGTRRGADEVPGLVRMDVECPAERGGRAVRFVVQDDGPGIPADQRERVFDRFHRTDAARDRASGGTGLGLAIVRAIAEAHGGRARASESFAGGGRVDLELPGFTASAGRAAASGSGTGVRPREARNA